MLSGQPSHHLSEDAFVAPSVPTIVERLVRTIITGRISSFLATAIGDDHPAQDKPIINPRFAVRLGEKGLKAHHLRVRKPE